jgi:transcriptional regulator with XRE-family HTH domain
MDSIGPQARLRRRKLGFTQPAVAEQAKIAHNHLVKWEKGQQSTALFRAFTVVEVLGGRVTLNDIDLASPADIPAILYDARIQRGLNLTQLGNLCGVHPRTLTMWERGQIEGAITGRVESALNELHMDLGVRW